MYYSSCNPTIGDSLCDDSSSPSCCVMRDTHIHLTSAYSNFPFIHDPFFFSAFPHTSGFVVSVVRDLGLPVKFIGVGEKIDDLRDFQAEDFVDALLGNDEATSQKMRARADTMFNFEGSGSGMKAMTTSSGSSQSSDPSARLRASFSGRTSRDDDDDDEEDDVSSTTTSDKPKRAKRPKPQSSKKKSAKKEK